MGSYFSTSSNNKKLQITISEKNQHIRHLKNKIRLLRDGENSTHYMKNGVVCALDEDITETITEIKIAKKYEYLVFSGGGIKGLAYGGALDILQSYGILKNIKGYAGASAGAILAAMLAIGYSVEELNEIIFTIDFSKFVDDKWGYIRDFINVIKDFGVAPGDYFMKKMGELIEKKTGNKDYTIDDLYNDKKITLVINGTDMNHKKTIYFYPNNRDKHLRNMPIRKALRISMSIPILFEPVHLNGCLCSDGGVLDNFPLHVFDGEYPGDSDARLNLCIPNASVLGLNVMSENDADEILYDKKDDINNVLTYFLAYISLFSNENERKILTPSYWKRTINIITANIPLTKFKLTKTEKENLIKNGKDYTAKFFSNDVLELDNI